MVPGAILNRQKDILSRGIWKNFIPNPEGKKAPDPDLQH
jgi:hypothetical protein